MLLLENSTCSDFEDQTTIYHSMTNQNNFPLMQLEVTVLDLLKVVKETNSVEAVMGPYKVFTSKFSRLVCPSATNPQSPLQNCIAS